MSLNLFFLLLLIFATTLFSIYSSQPFFIAALLFFSLLLILPGIWSFAAALWIRSRYKEIIAIHALQRTFASGEEVILVSNNLPRIVAISCYPDILWWIKKEFSHFRWKSRQIRGKAHTTQSAYTGLPAGFHEIESIHLCVEDLFRIFQWKIRLQRKISFFVRPPLYASRPYAHRLSSRERSTTQKKHLFSTVRQISMDAKKFEPGDEVRHIVWKKFAKSGELIVRKVDHARNIQKIVSLCLLFQHNPSLFWYKLPRIGKIFLQYHAFLLWQNFLQEIYQLWTEGFSIYVRIMIPGVNKSQFIDQENSVSFDQFMRRMIKEDILQLVQQNFFLKSTLPAHCQGAITNLKIPGGRQVPLTIPQFHPFLVENGEGLSSLKPSVFFWMQIHFVMKKIFAPNS